MLSQICVKVANSEANLKIAITGVRVGHIVKTGTFTYNGSATTTQVEDATNTANATLINRTNWTDLASSSASPTDVFDQDVTTTTLTGVTAAQAFSSSSFKSWILMPQALTAATDYTDNNVGAVTTATNPKLNGAYLALKMSIVDQATEAPIVAEQWCYWPINTEWKPGYKYTYTINAGSGGYQPTDQTGTAGLDPVLGGSVIWFDPDCTIDAWVADNTGISEPAVAVTDKTTAGTPLSYNVEAGTHGTYTIVVTGLTNGNTVDVAATGNFTATVSPTTVDESGRVVITGNLSANKDAAVTSVITLTESGGGTTTTITVNQAAATTL